MKKRYTHVIAPSEITAEDVYHGRREFLRAAGLAGIAGLTGTACDAQGDSGGKGNAGDVLRNPGAAPLTSTDLGPLRPSRFSTDEAPNSWEDVTTYNNFYEFGTGKDDPHRNARDFVTDPWRVKVGGACEKPGEYTLEDILKPHVLEDRVYRLRCVEAWSMVVPWVGFPLGDLLKRFLPTSHAKYVRFETLFDPQQMPGQRRRILDWPYLEGLRMDEAMHPLAIMAVGVYGKALPNQNGAPLRLMVPWKYGFKSIKSIVSIRFTENPPVSSWEQAAPHEYGFYANVNPEVDHPRWSQASERRIGGGLFSARQPTLMFNGYGDEVASLYSGMDLRRNF